jgi:hypothetical protein
MPQYRPERPDKGWIIPQSYKAYLTKESIAYLVEQASRWRGIRVCKDNAS